MKDVELVIKMPLDEWELMKRSNYMWLGTFKAITNGKELKHGSWERISEDVLECSACKNRVVDGTTFHVMKYCPICGAEMNTKED